LSSPFSPEAPVSPFFLPTYALGTEPPRKPKPVWFPLSVGPLFSLPLRGRDSSAPNPDVVLPLFSPEPFFSLTDPLGSSTIPLFFLPGKISSRLLPLFSSEPTARRSLPFPSPPPSKYNRFLSPFSQQVFFTFCSVVSISYFSLLLIRLFSSALFFFLLLSSSIDECQLEMFAFLVPEGIWFLGRISFPGRTLGLFFLFFTCIYPDCLDDSLRTGPGRPAALPS